MEHGVNTDLRPECLEDHVFEFHFGSAKVDEQTNFYALSDIPERPEIAGPISNGHLYFT